MLRFVHLFVLPPFLLEIAAAGRLPPGDVAGAVSPSARTKPVNEVGSGAEFRADGNVGAKSILFAVCNETAVNWAALPEELRHCDEPSPASTKNANDDSGRLATPGGPGGRPRLRGQAHLKKGSIVELFADGSYFATPAIVTGHDTEESSTARFYSLLNVYADELLPRVDAEFVHPYQVYEDGMRASCNVGRLDKVYETPCAVVSHTRRESGLVLYEVSYLDSEDDALVQDYLPFSRVRRIHGRRNGSMLRYFCR